MLLLLRKSVLFFFCIVFFLFSAKFVPGYSNEEDMFPQKIELYVYDEYEPFHLEDIKRDEEDRIDNIKKGYVARYLPEDSDISMKAVWIHIWEMKDETAADHAFERFIPNKKAKWEETYEQALKESKEQDKTMVLGPLEWGNTISWPGISGIYIKTTVASREIHYTCDLQRSDSCRYLDYTVMFAAPDNYMVIVDMNTEYYYHKSRGDEIAKENVDLIQPVLEQILKKHPNYGRPPKIGVIGLGIAKQKAKNLFDQIVSKFKKNKDRKESDEIVSPTLSEKPSDKNEASVIQKKEEEVCGNNLCDEHLGETCKTCPEDCTIDDYCCSPGSKYLYPRYFSNKIFYPFDNVGGMVPNGSIVLSSDATKEEVFGSSFTKRMCYKGTVITADCTKNEHCPEGVCVNRRCTVEKSEETFEKVELLDEIKEVVSESNSYKTKHVADYITRGNTTSFEEEEGLDIKLLMQGNTGGKIPKVNEGDEVVVQLEIENTSDDMVAVTAGIVYPGADIGDFLLTEKSYNASYGWWYKGSLNWSSLRGAVTTKLFAGGRFFVMPKKAKLIITSKVVPEQTGYLDAQAIIYYSAETTFIQPKGSENLYHRGFWPEQDHFEYTTSRVKEYTPEDYKNKLNFQTIEVSESIVVKQRPCNWLFCW